MTTFSRFTRLSLLGKGGCSSVWKAWDPMLDRWIALKIDASSHEARITASLSHPNIMAIHECGKEGDKSWVAMEFIDGETIDRLPPLNPRQVAEIIRDAARGVQYAHERGVIHRDLKPANIMRTKDHRTVVMDFGLAHKPSVSPTLPGEIVGTSIYMSPSQALGGPPDVKDDIHALGITMNELLGGFIPRPLLPIILKCTETQAKDRYQSAAELGEALDGFLNRVSWKRVALAVGAVLLAMLLAATGGLSLGMERSREDSAKLGALVQARLLRAHDYYMERDYPNAKAEVLTVLECDPSNEAALNSLQAIKDCGVDN